MMKRYVFQTTSDEYDFFNQTLSSPQVPDEEWIDNQESDSFSELERKFDEWKYDANYTRILDRFDGCIWTSEQLGVIVKYAPWLSLVSKQVHYLPC